MKICFITSTLNNTVGQGKLSLEIIKGAIDHGFEPEIIVAERTGFPNEHVLLGGIVKILKNFFKIRRIARGCDLIHSFDGWPNSAVAYLINFGLGKKRIITGIGSATVKPLNNIFRRLIVKKSYETADVFVAISRYTAEEVKKHIPKLKVSIINPGVKMVSEHKCQPEIFEKIKKLQPYILSVGTLKERKGFRVSVSAFNKISDRFPQYKYVIINNQPMDEHVDSLLRFVKEKNEAGKITIFNHIPDEELQEFYQHADVFVLLPINDKYDFEGFGMVFVEAGAHGVPSISTKGNGSEDAVINNVTGYSVNQGDVNEAAGAMVNIIDNRTVRNQFGENARKMALELTWEKVSAKYIKLYEELKQKN